MRYSKYTKDMQCSVCKPSGFISIVEFREYVMFLCAFCGKIIEIVKQEDASEVSS